MTLKINQTGLPPQEAHWSYGASRMRRISLKSAKRVVGERAPLPRMGWELPVRKHYAVSGGVYWLDLQNVSGDYYLACTSVPVADWPEFFGVEIVEGKHDPE